MISQTQMWADFSSGFLSAMWMILVSVAHHPVELVALIVMVVLGLVTSAVPRRGHRRGRAR